MDAYAVATLFDPGLKQGNSAVWSKITEASEVTGMPIHAMLHCSWHVSIHYQMQEMFERLDQFAKTRDVIRIQTAGLGIFTAAKPILYLPIVKTAEMMRVHEQLWEILAPVSSSQVMYYAPESWMPHITLNDEGTEIDRMCLFKQKLLFEPLVLSFNVDHFAVIYRNGPEEGLMQTFQFKGRS